MTKSRQLGTGTEHKYSPKDDTRALQRGRPVAHLKYSEEDRALRKRAGTADPSSARGLDGGWRGRPNSSNVVPAGSGSGVSLGGRVTPTETALYLPDDLSRDEWEDVGRAIAMSERAVTWWMGDWHAFGVDQAGRGDPAWADVEAMADQLGVDPLTIQTAGWLSREIPPDQRVAGVPWLHHRYVAKLTPEERQTWLEQSRDEGWPASRLRYEIQASQWEPVDSDIVLPTGTFQVLYADPPWPTAGGSKRNYPTMSFGEIATLTDGSGRSVSDLPDEDAILFLWVVNEYLVEGISVMQDWGFDYRSNVVWDKQTPIGIGAWVRQRHEILLIGVRGSFPHPKAQDRIDSVLGSPRRRHSQKPDEVRAWIETMYPRAKRIELFAREAPPGWAVFGNQVASDAGD